MPTKISEMTPADLPLAGDEELEVTIPGSDPLTRKVTAQDIANLERPAVNALSGSGGVTVDCSLGSYFTLTLTGNVTSFTFTNVPEDGKSVMIKIIQDSTPRTVALGGFEWAGGTPPAVSTGSGDVDVLGATTFDGGTSWQATLAKAFA